MSRIAKLVEAMDWALSEIDGRTRYTDNQQRQNCIDIATDALDAYKAGSAGQDADGWIVASGDGNRFRTWKDGWSDWTDDRSKAVRYARREDAEAVHQEDEDAWFIQPYALVSGSSTGGVGR